MKIVADSQIPFIKDFFESYGDLILKSGREIEPLDIKDADMLLVRSITPVTASLLERSSVKFVGSITAGADHLDIQFLEAAAIQYAFAKGFNAPPVADYVVSMIAALKRKKILPDRKLKAAVIGVGNIGRLVVERLKILGMEVIMCDPPRALADKHFISTALAEIEGVDIISLHVPLTKEGSYPTYHCIDDDFLRKQKPGCVIINASRGDIISPPALEAHGKHLIWCLDVWPQEPCINQNLLKQALIATPHIAGYSVQSKRRGIEMIYDQACKKKIIHPKDIPALSLTKQTLNFAGESHQWEDIVLGIFNPVILTAMMRSQICSAKDPGQAFDEMRRQFNYRYEFSFTNIMSSPLPGEDQQILKALNITTL
ncbi:MAG: 4-phosphoerythronate dehydrogenase [Gammaproteobacteria bacterium]|nr:4-phosphoerythronate dehydrogenase [Gammaproteobacteria bacterium]